MHKLASLNPNVSLHPHQADAVDFILNNKKGIIAHGTGLGKTLTSIASFEKLRETGGAKRAIVIVPASLRDNYAKNIGKYTNSTYSIYGPKNDKGSLSIDTPSKSDYNIISYEMYKKDPAGIRERLGADTLIVDEAHRARNEASDINDVLTNEVKRYSNVMTLTGSVVNNYPSDISPLMDATVGREANTIGSRADFNRKYITKLRGGKWGSSKKNTVTTVSNRGKLSKALKNRVHYVSHADMAAALPPVSMETISTPMTKEQKKLYLYAYRDLPPIIRTKIRKNIPVSQKEMSGIFSRMMQARKVMTDPAAMDVNYEGSDPYSYSPKVKRVIDDLSAHLIESRKNKAVIYGNLIDSQLDSVRESLDRKHIPYATYFGTGNKGNATQQRKESLGQYMSGKKRVLLISGAGGEGLDLKGSSMLQMLEGHYNPEKIRQAEARVRRMGDHPDKPILIKRYVSTLPQGGFDKFLSVFGKKHPTSIDEYIYTVADRKDKLNQEFRDSLMKGAGLQEVFEKGKHDPRLRIDNAKFEDLNIAPINHNGEVVGFFRPTISLTGNPMMGAIYVLPEHRRKGIAKEVVRDFYAKHPNMIYITSDTNVASQALAKSVGLQYTRRPKGNKSGMIFEKTALDAVEMFGVKDKKHYRKLVKEYGSKSAADMFAPNPMPAPKAPVPVIPFGKPSATEIKPLTPNALKRSIAIARVQKDPDLLNLPKIASSLSKTAYSMKSYRILMNGLKDMGVSMERAKFIPSGIIRNTKGEPVKLVVQRGENNPASVLFHEYGHLLNPVHKSPVSVLNTPARLNQEISSNRSAAKFLMGSGGTRNDIRTFYKNMKNRISTYVDGVNAHSSKSLIGTGPSTPADINYLSQSAGIPLSELKNLFLSIKI